MSSSNIEPLARAITERMFRQTEPSDQLKPPVSDAEVTVWVDAHWECAAAELEAGIVDEYGKPIPGADWELGLAAYRERTAALNR